MNIRIAKLTFPSIVLAVFVLAPHALHARRGLRSPSQSADSTSRSVWDGVYTAEQAERGHSVYRAQCEVCHGEELTGGDEVPPLAGPQFLANWNGLTLGDLFERIRKTMPANDPGKLSREQNADVIAYLLAFNMFPSGKAELPAEAPLLQQIRIESTKPDPDNKDKPQSTRMR